MMNLKKIFARGWGSDTLMTMFSFFVRTANFIFLLPILLKYLKTEELSVYYVFQIVYSFICLLIGSLGPNFVRMIAYAMGGADESEISDLRGINHREQRGPNLELLGKLIPTVRLTNLFLALFVLLVLGGLGSFVVNKPISYLASPSVGWVAWGGFVLGSSIITYGNCYGCYLEGVARIALYRRWEGSVLLASVVVSAVALLLNLGLIGLVVSQQVVFVLGLFGRRYFAWRELRTVGCRGFATGFDRKVFLVVWSKAWRAGSGVVMHSGVFQLSSLFYAQIERPEVVAPYLLSVKLIGALTEFSKAPFYSKIPKMAGLYARSGKSAELLGVAKRGFRLSYLIFVVGFVFLGLFGGALLGLMKSNTGLVPVSLWALLGMACFFERYAAMHLNLYTLSNHIIWHRVYLVSGLIYLAVFFFTYHSVGLYAYPLGILVSEAGFSCWYTSRHSLGLFKVGFFEFERSVGFPAFFVVVAFVFYAGWVSLN